MTDLVTIHHWPPLRRPVLVVALDGWIDAGLAAANAVSSLLDSTPHDLLATFDADELIDHRARRPVLRVTNGVDTEFRWPEIRLEVAADAGGRSLLVLHGPEPDMRWHRFVDEVVALAARLGVELVIGLGAFPAPVPHTRPVRLTATASTPEMAAKVGFLPATIEVPAGTQAALEWAFGQAGVPAVGVWARVPHYASAMPYPAASAALLAELTRLTDIPVETGALDDAAAATSGQIEQLIAGSPDHGAMIRQLEAQNDEETPPVDFGPLPSGDELAAELERFLRGER